MKALLYNLSVLLFVAQISFGQSHKLPDSILNTSTVSKIAFSGTNCENIAKWAKSDISNKTVFLFLQGGVAPKRYTTDEAFEIKYGIYFQDFGDVMSTDKKCVIEYNSIVFDYLTKKYGKQWAKEIRRDVIGFKNWKRKS